MTRHKHGQKRRGPSVVDIDGEAEIDDMAVAASYAALVYTAEPPPTPASDDNEIELSDDGDNSSDSESSVEDEENEEKKDDNESDSDESDIDLAKERAEIEKMQAKESDTKTAPKTEHELDPYKTPLPELEKKFQLSLTVDDDQKTRLTAKKGQNDVNLCLAGEIKSHLVHDRTIIVESSAQNGMMAPLDEGSLLVFRMYDKGVQTLIPLGRVFEVFGPVRRPLYTVRLPPSKKQKPTNNKKKKEKLESPEKMKGEAKKDNATTSNNEKGTASMADSQLDASKNNGTAEATSLHQEPVERPTNESETASTSSTKQIHEPTGDVILKDANKQSMPVRTVPKPETRQGDVVSADGRNDWRARVEKSSGDGAQSSESRHENSCDGKPNEGLQEKADEISKSQSCEHTNMMEDTDKLEKATSPVVEESDPWALNGKYTNFLSSHPNLSIFYVFDEAKTIDAESMLRMSTRGCDASNVYDEEVVNVNEMYFSDDEEERQLKKNRRKNRKSDPINGGRTNAANTGGPPGQYREQRGGRGRGHFQHTPIPAGFHQQQPHHQQYPQVYQQPYPYPPQHQQHPHVFQSPYPHQPYPQQHAVGHATAFRTGVPPPPPPPPPPGNPQPTYMPTQAGYAAPQQYSNQAPCPHPTYAGGPQQQPHYHPYAATPPVAPGAPHPHYTQNAPSQGQGQAQQQSDTVYYNYS